MKLSHKQSLDKLLTVFVHRKCFFEPLLLSAKFLDVGGFAERDGRCADVTQVAGTNKGWVRPRQSDVSGRLNVAKQHERQQLHTRVLIVMSLKPSHVIK